MRDRYWVRIGRIERGLRTISTECFRIWREQGRPPPYTEFRNKWLLEHHNIVVSKQTNGVDKVGFASRGDMLMFVLRYS